MRIIVSFILALFLVVAFPVVAQENMNQPVPPEQPQEQPLPSREPQDRQELMPSQFEDKENGGGPGEFADPREIQDVLRQIKDLRREINRILKRAKKANGAANEVAGLNELLGTLGQFEQKLNASDVDRSVLQEFWDAQLWEVFNGLRLRVEFPIEAQNVKRDLKRLEKMISAKNFAIEGFDMNAVREKVNEIKNAIAQAEASFAQGDWESVQENMQVIYEGSHPGEMTGVLNQLRDIAKALKSIKSDEVKAEVRDILSEVFAAANSGEFREANMMLQDIQGELWRILNAVKKKAVINEDLRLRMQRLEQKIQEKMQQQGEMRGTEKLKSPQSNLGPYTPYRSASIIGTIVNFLGLGK